jgi:hypothetical protein
MDFSNIEITCDESSPYITGTVELDNAFDYALFNVGDPIAVEYAYSIWNLIVDQKTLSRGESASHLYQLALISPLAKKDAPFHATITKIYTETKLASEVVFDLIGTNSWDMFDWYIPVEQLQFVDMTPLAIARKITAAVGGLIESLPNGNVVVRKTYPDVGTPLQLPDTDVISINETVAAQTLFNRLDIYNVPIANAGVNDYLEFIVDKDDNTKGIVNAYPSPVRPVTLVHTGDPLTTITPLGYVTRTEPELNVEFKAGKAATKYPIDSIVSVSWNVINLGGVSYSGKNLSAAVAGESLLNISYKTSCYSFNVTGVAGDVTQFVLTGV